MKNYRRGLWTVLVWGVAIGAYGDVIVTQPATVPAQSATVIVPTATPVVISPSNAAAANLDREGNWYVVCGPADLDRYNTIIRVKDEKHNSVVTIPYTENDVEIYRRGEHISYMDVNPGDNVTVRFKSS